MRGKKWIFLGIMSLVLLISLMTIGTKTAAQQLFEKELIQAKKADFVPDEFVVKFKKGVTPDQINELNKKCGVSIKNVNSKGKFDVLHVPKGKSTPAMTEIYNQSEIVEYAHLNYICYANQFPLDSPNDPLYAGYQWNFRLINLEPAWNIQTCGNSDIIVAVLDTGIAYENYDENGNGTYDYLLCPDLSGVNFVTGYDYINGDSHPNDDNQHGTHVTGTIAQSTNNGYGVAGIASHTSIMPVKVLDADGSGTVTSLCEGIDYAVDHGARVINMSLGFPSSVTPQMIPELGDTVVNAYSQGCIIVASSGNEGVGVVSLPAAYPEVIAVGAVNSEDTRASYSQYGSALELVAPGGDTVDRDKNGYTDGILQQTISLKNPLDCNSFWFFTGTSMASPHVSGAAALMLAVAPTLTPDQIRNIMAATAVDLGTVGPDIYYGNGRLDALAALNYLASGVVNEEFYDDFTDLSLSKWTETGEGDWNVETPIEAHRGRAAHSDDSDTESIIELKVPVDLSGKSGAQLSFWRWVDDGLDNGEYLKVDIWNGSQWVTIANWTNLAGDTDYWVYHSYNLKNYLVNNFSVRFRTKESDTSEHAYVDDVRIVSYGTPDTESPLISGATGDTTATTGDTVTISATISDNTGVASATVHYTPIDAVETTVSMTEGAANVWSALVPVALNKTGTITYFVTAQDLAGNPATSGPYSITVTDNDPPSQVTDLAATAQAGGTIQLSWSAATDNIGLVNYIIYRATTPITGSTDLTGLTLSTVGTDTLYIDNPAQDGTYYYAVKGVDAAGNTGEVSNSPGATKDTTPPVISSIVSNATDSSATITWTTNETSSSVVRYDTTPPTPLSPTTSDPALVTSHSVTLTGLTAATTYSYQVESTDAAGNTASDNNGGAYYTFVTTPPATPTAYVSITMSKQLISSRWRVTAAVTIVDASGQPIAGATVYGQWSGLYSGNVSGVTGSNGKVNFLTGLLKTNGTVCFGVVRIVKNSQDYLLSPQTPSNCITK